MIHSLLDTQLLLFFIAFPVVSTILLYSISTFLYKHRWKAIHLSVQGSAIFYVIAVILLLEKLIQISIIGYALIFIILVLAIILIIQWKTKTEVVLKDGLKVLTRICFLLFGVIYVLLISYEIIQMIYIIYMD